MNPVDDIVDRLRHLLPEGTLIVESTARAEKWSDAMAPIGLLFLPPGADRISVAASFYKHLAPGALVVMEPFSDKAKLEVVEKRLGRQTLQWGWAVFYP